MKFIVLTGAIKFETQDIPKSHNVKLSNGMTVPIGVIRPWTWEIAELFKIENGLIRQIEAICQEVPYGMNSGWSSWKEGLSSQAR